MYLRAACLGWRAATEGPKAKGNSGSDRRFKPCQWILLEEVFQSKGEEMLLVNTNTSRFLRRREYSGERTKDAIMAWINKKLGPAMQNLTIVNEAEKVVTGDDVAVLAYVHDLSGAHSDELDAASRLEDTVSFYQTTSPDVAKLFHIDPEEKRPSVVLLKKEEEKLTVFDGEFRVSAIAEFISANKIPLITTLTQETAPTIFDNPIKKQILLFAVAKESSKFVCILKEAAKSFKGKVLFVFVELDNEEVGEPVANYFGITGQETTVLAYTGNEDAKKFFFSGEISLDNIKEFAQDFLEDKLTPFYKSDPVPESVSREELSNIYFLWHY
ncbi:protein disulfide isomerase-like 1-4 [Hordeum vulgare subsp. vulgare]|uniref:protein disulfide isomerase-like 1-4 n=1 Tax=Hordeum vulgare subsp. vulgare TaxID=112509 RepID=UPI001D1A5177|nr:protein disulfide isomerase-like 1-4 [Hordeum vulgare subsp. vulgare]